MVHNGTSYCPLHHPAHHSHSGRIIPLPYYARLDLERERYLSQVPCLSSGEVAAARGGSGDPPSCSVLVLVAAAAAAAAAEVTAIGVAKQHSQEDDDDVTILPILLSPMKNSTLMTVTMTTIHYSLYFAFIIPIG